MLEHLLSGYHTDRLDVADPRVLERLGTRTGLDVVLPGQEETQLLQQLIKQQHRFDSVTGSWSRGCMIAITHAYAV